MYSLLGRDKNCNGLLKKLTVMGKLKRNLKGQSAQIAIEELEEESQYIKF